MRMFDWPAHARLYIHLAHADDIRYKQTYRHTFFPAATLGGACSSLPQLWNHSSSTWCTQQDTAMLCSCAAQMIGSVMLIAFFCLPYPLWNHWSSKLDHCYSQHVITFRRRTQGGVTYLTQWWLLTNVLENSAD